MSEATEQMKVVEWCRVTDYLRQKDGLMPYGISRIFHIPNGGWRSKSEAAKLKAMGVRAGVPDLMLPLPVGGKHGLWIEMKRVDGGRLSEAQESELAALEQVGYVAVAVHGAEAAIEAIRSYLDLEAEAV